MGYTERIAAGDFTPITPARRYRDEFSKLALNINRMVSELDRHHRILVESHKQRAVGNLVAGVAHELNNPMNNIMLTASLMLEDYDELADEERLEMLADLVSQVERSKAIVANLLDFARQSETRSEPLDIRQIVDETVQLVGNRIRMKKVRIETELPEDLPVVHGDRQMLRQVFVNLILNALDVLPEKGEISIGKSAIQREGFLAVDVWDRSMIPANHSSEEHEFQSLEDLLDARGFEVPDALGQPGLVDRRQLRHVDHAGARQAGLALAQAYVAGHGGQAQVRGDGRHDGGGDGAAVEAIVLDHNRRPTPARR